MNSVLIGAGLFKMNLGDGRLPINIDVNRNLHDQLHPRDFSTAAMTGYYLALWEYDAPIIAQGKFAALSARPSRRAEIITLLETNSITEFDEVQEAALGRAEFVGHGPIAESGARTVTVAATISRISRIDIDPTWAASTTPYYISHDIIECVDQIRRKRPHFHEGGSWAHRSDDELENELREYQNYLTRNSR
ncbi:hypothetical protein OG874_02550 [Nocardia sp. NBC_00565]|uniref:hypothetical protein n=1 Tax=Nocardia sp. NBC_00565 TaxID=2975993 RepID=UPI002E7FE7A5|nr:hypothetical protein [Nocardia sp. NBC_00565]WUC04118.1 hypothetical protein OG874_02550 [Nocardia sp. NBC_00565]